jgi:adenosylmethionine-8-amino-7-oxononanoate aminotransferase
MLTRRNKMKHDSAVWHPFTQMSEWEKFDEIVKGKGMWL